MSLTGVQPQPQSLQQYQQVGAGAFSPGAFGLGAFGSRRKRASVSGKQGKRSFQQLFDDYETFYQEFEPTSLLIETMYETITNQLRIEEKRNAEQTKLGTMLSAYGLLLADTANQGVAVAATAAAAAGGRKDAEEEYRGCVKTAADVLTKFATGYACQLHQAYAQAQALLQPLIKRNRGHAKRFQLFTKAKSTLAALQDKLAAAVAKKGDLAKISDLERQRDSVQQNAKRLIEQEFHGITKTRKIFDCTLVQVNVKMAEAFAGIAAETKRLALPDAATVDGWRKLGDALHKEYDEEFGVVPKGDVSFGDTKSFITTERKYIGSLFYLIKAFGFSMLNDSSLFTDLNRTDVDQIYSSLPSLLELHADVIGPALQERKDSSLYFTPGMLNIIIAEYTKYFLSYNSSVARLDQCLGKSPRLRDIVDELERLEPYRGSLRLQLSLPLERVKEILAFLEGVTPKTDHGSVEYFGILQSTEVFRQLTHLSELATRNPSYELLETMSTCMDGAQTFQYPPGDRSVIAAGPLAVVRASAFEESAPTFSGEIDVDQREAAAAERERPRHSYFSFLKTAARKRDLLHYFLFSDILVLARRVAEPQEAAGGQTAPRRHARYAFYAKFPLREIQLKCFDVSSQRMNFEIVSKTGVSFGVYGFDTEAQRRSFVGSFLKARDEINTSKVFFTPLTDLLKSMRETGREYPSIIDDTLGTIVSGEAQTAPLIFRKTVSIASEVGIVCKQIDNWMEVKYSRHNSDTLGCIFLRWLRCLPEPLVPPELFDKAIEATFPAQRTRRVALARAVVAELPPANKAALQKIVLYLFAIAENYAKFGTSVTELAVIVGPLLVRARNYCKGDFEVASLTPIYYFTEMLIRGNKEIFATAAATADSRAEQQQPQGGDAGTSVSASASVGTSFDSSFGLSSSDADDLSLSKLPPPTEYLKHLQYTVGEQRYVLSCVSPISECDFDDYDDYEWDRSNVLSLTIKDIVMQGEVELKTTAVASMFKVMAWKTRWLALRKGYLYVFCSQKDQVPAEIIPLANMKAYEKTSKKRPFVFALRSMTEDELKTRQEKSARASTLTMTSAPLAAGAEQGTAGTAATSVTASSSLSKSTAPTGNAVLPRSSLSLRYDIKHSLEQAGKFEGRKLVFSTSGRQECMQWVDAINKCAQNSD